MKRAKVIVRVEIIVSVVGKDKVAVMILSVLKKENIWVASSDIAALSLPCKAHP